MPESRSTYKSSTIIVRSDERPSHAGGRGKFSGSFFIQTEHSAMPISQTFVDGLFTTFDDAQANALMLARRKVDGEDDQSYALRPRID